MQHKDSITDIKAFAAPTKVVVER